MNYNQVPEPITATEVMKSVIYNDFLLQLCLWKVGKPLMFISMTCGHRSDQIWKITSLQIRSQLLCAGVRTAGWSKKPLSGLDRAPLFAQSLASPNFSLFVTWIFNWWHEYWKMLKGKTPVLHFKSHWEYKNNFFYLFFCLCFLLLNKYWQLESENQTKSRLLYFPD